MKQLSRQNEKKKKALIWKTDSEAKTRQVGVKIAKKLKPGARVALIGGLGAGKTALVKGIARGLGFKKTSHVRSPTFVIFHIYDTKVPIYHLDFYRLNAQTDLETIGMFDYVMDPNAITLIEWATQVPHVYHECFIEIKLTITGKNKRTIRMTLN